MARSAGGVAELCKPYDFAVALLIWVKDNGVGVAPEYDERVFTLFQLLHWREEDSRNGMGLAICRKTAEYHGITLTVQSFTVQSVPGQGSTLILTLFKV